MTKVNGFQREAVWLIHNLILMKCTFASDATPPFHVLTLCCFPKQIEIWKVLDRVILTNQLTDDMASNTFSCQKKTPQHFHRDTSDCALPDFTLLCVAAPLNSVSSGSLLSLMILWAPLMTPSPQCKYPVLYYTLDSLPVLYS